MKPTTTILTIKNALAAAISTLTAMSMLSDGARAPSSIAMTERECAHLTSTFLAGAAPTNGSAQDTVWAQRQYAPMYIHSSALQSYRERISRAFPDHAITFDVIFAASDKLVPWHADFDSLGPFEASTYSIARGDFITVHANLISPTEGGGQLRTLDSIPVAIVHWLSNRWTNSFGSLAEWTEPFAARLGAVTHDGTVGVGNVFNNLRAHSVTAGAGRVSYVVRLVRKDVRLSGGDLRDAASGLRSTRRIPEFERFLPHLKDDRMRVGDFPWGSVSQ